MNEFRHDVPPVVPRKQASVHPALWATVAFMAAIELAMNLAEMRVLPPVFSRWVIYSGFAFFDTMFELAVRDGVVHAQLLWSLVTHAFLHGGWLHLGLNAAAFLGLGHAITREAGIRVTATVFVLTAIVGALSFAIVTDSRAPLVGASGAVFGFLGTVTAWQERWLADRGASRRPIWARIAGVIFINAVMALGIGGMLIAWEAHLGGFAAGWLLGYAFLPDRRQLRNPWRA